MNTATIFSPNLLARLVIFVLAITLAACSGRDHGLITPLTPPLLYDDGDTESLRQCITSQLHYLQHQNSERLVLKGSPEISLSHLEESLKTLQEIVDLEASPLEFDRILAENFTVYQAAGRKSSASNQVLVTGYFEPVLKGSLTRKAPFLYPVYGTPEDLHVLQDKGSPPSIGRLNAKGTLVPYWTRREIETSHILQGDELVFLDNPFDVFLLHVQGSGKVKLQDGSIRSLRYAANNGWPYSSIGKLLVDEGKLSLADASIPTIRAYLHQHPEESERIFYHNRRYIFFQWDNQNIVRGAIGEPLTPLRSIAIDPEMLPMGAIGYLVSRLPMVDDSGRVTGWSLLQRFVFPQDRGSAIKGPGRVDIFMGGGDYAEYSAGIMKEPGKLFFLLKNDFELTGEPDE